jgi:hypothetical protein
MDKVIKRPIGLALLITAAVALTAQPPRPPVAAIAPPPSTGPLGPVQRPLLVEESPTIARLVLRVESLLQPTTAN